MFKKVIASLAIVTLAGVIFATLASAGGTPPSTAASSYEPVLDPSHFVAVIDNPYFPLPVGRTLVYKGIKDGKTQIDRVTVTSDTKVLEGVTATAVHDVATHHGKLLEKTTDWYAQDDQGNVWYLGENTKEYLPDGTVDPSGSWQSDVNDGEPGIVMESNPQIPDGYRQEYLKGEAEDTAWIVNRGGSVTVPYGTVHRVLTSLEFARIEPHVVDRKIYAPGLGIVSEVSLTGAHETANLVKVIG